MQIFITKTQTVVYNCLYCKKSLFGENKMKKTIKLICLLLVLAMALCSCGKEKEDDSFNYSKGLDKNGHWEGIKALDYIKLCDVDSIPVSKKDIQEQIDSFIAAYPDSKSITDPNQTVADGDSVNIDYVGKMDGVAFDNGSAEGQTVTIGVTNFIDGFLPQLIGHHPGETFDIDVTFPDPYPNNPDFSGKPAVFTITINYIVEYVEMEWGDDFVNTMLSSNYGWTTAKQAEDAITKFLAEDYVFHNSTFEKEVPESMVNYQYDAMIDYYKQMASYYSVDLETVLTYYVGVTTIDELKEVYKAQCTEDAQFYLLYQAVAEAKNISISEDELMAYFKEQTGTDDYTQYQSVYGLPYLKSMGLYDKVEKTLYKAVKITE